MKKKLINLNDNKVSEIEISDKIFGIKVYPRSYSSIYSLSKCKG